MDKPVTNEAATSEAVSTEPELSPMEQAIKAIEETEIPEAIEETEAPEAIEETEPNDDVKVEETEPSEPESQNKEPLSKAWVKLNKREKELQNQTQELKQQAQWINENRAAIKQAQQLLELAKTPREFLKAQNMSIEDFTEGLLQNPPETKTEIELEAMKKELEAIKKERDAVQKQQEAERIRQEYQTAQQQYISQNLDKYPIIKKYEAANVVWETTLSAAQAGEVLTHEQACEMVEHYLNNNPEAVKQYFGVEPEPVVKEPEPKPEPKVEPKVTKTLSNNLESQPSVHSDNMTDEERMQEAIKALSME